jgi:hypothetical protein
MHTTRALELEEVGFDWHQGLAEGFSNGSKPGNHCRKGLRWHVEIEATDHDKISDFALMP